MADLLVAADIGYGFVKVISEDGPRALFPSAVIPARGSGDLASALGSGTQKHRLSVQGKTDLKPREYLVGQSALIAGASRSWDTTGTGRDDYLILVLSALGAVGAEGKVDLVLGLPLSVYLNRDERRALRDRVMGLSGWISWDGQDAKHVEVEAVSVLPQAVGAFYSALLGTDGAHLAGQMVAVLDTGYHTTDYMLLVPGDGGVSVPDEARSGSIDAGMSQVIDAVCAHVSSETGVPFAPPEGLVEATLRNGGHIVVRGRDIDLNPSYDAALRDLAGRIDAKIQRVWGDRLDYLASLLVTGGAGQAVAPHLRLPGIKVMDGAVWANAQGFLYRRQRQVARPLR